MLRFPIEKRIKFLKSSILIFKKFLDITIDNEKNEEKLSYGNKDFISFDIKGTNISEDRYYNKKEIIQLQ